MANPNSIRSLKKALKNARCSIYVGRSSYDRCLSMTVNVVVPNKDFDNGQVLVAFEAQATDLYHPLYKKDKIGTIPDPTHSMVELAGVSSWYAAKMSARVDVLNSFRMDYESAERCLNFAKLIKPLADKYYVAYPDCEVSRIFCALQELGTHLNLRAMKIIRDRGGEVSADEWNITRVDRS